MKMEVPLEKYQIQHKRIVSHFMETGSLGKTRKDQIAVLQTLIVDTFQLQIDFMPTGPREKIEKKIHSFVYKFQKRYSKKHSHHPEQILALPWSLLYFELPLDVINFIKNKGLFNLDDQVSVNHAPTQDYLSSLKERPSDTENPVS